MKKVCAWADSSVSFAWIQNVNKVYKCFIQTRVKEIRELLFIGCWHLINTNQNPSDIISRGLLITDLIQSKLWFEGPIFLTLPENSWPKFNIGDKFDFEINKEEKVHNFIISEVSDACIRSITVNSLNNNGLVYAQKGEDTFTAFICKKLYKSIDISLVIDIHRFSSILKLFRVERSMEIQIIIISS